jgi:hypothetical protein
MINGFDTFRFQSLCRKRGWVVGSFLNIFFSANSIARDLNKLFCKIKYVNASLKPASSNLF